MNKKVFISYGKEDGPSAKKLFEMLKTAGFEPWLDTESLLGGQKWRSTIPRAIKESRFFIALLSSSSVNRKGFINREIAEALDVLKEYPEDEIYLIPTRLDDCNPNHASLHDLHWIDLFPDWEEGIRNLFKALGYAEDKKTTAPLKAFVQVRLQPGGFNRKKITELLKAIPHVSQADYLYGEYDLSLTINAANYEMLSQTIKKINRLPLVVSSSTNFSAGPIDDFDT